MADAELAVRAVVKHEAHGFALDVDLRFAAGITCVLGPSGAGKSTLLGAIAGLGRPDRGRIALGDEVWFDSTMGVDRPVHLRRVAYVFQRLALFPHLDAVRNVAYGMNPAVAWKQRAARARELLEHLGVAHLAARRPRTFSGGEAQRVALARALAMSPKVVLLDEPFSALDHALKVQLASVVRDLVDELEVPLIHVTHSQGEARALADRVIRIERGHVVADGTADAVLGPRAPRWDDRDDDEGSDGDRDDGEVIDPRASTAGGEAVPDEAAPRGKRRRAPDLEGTPMPELKRR